MSLFRLSIAYTFKSYLAASILWGVVASGGIHGRG